MAEPALQRAPAAVGHRPAVAFGAAFLRIAGPPGSAFPGVLAMAAFKDIGTYGTRRARTYLRTESRCSGPASSSRKLLLKCAF
jgi:hypothetical protein